MSLRRVRFGAALGSMAVLVLLAVPVLSQENTIASSLELADEVAAEVASIRGWEFKHPVEKHLYSEEQLREYIIKKLDEEYPEAETRRTEAFLHLVGALPADMRLKETFIEVLMSQIGGFYDPASRAFYMIDRKDVDWGESVDRILIAHELTHALDDQYVDLDAMQKARVRTEDGEFILGSLVEGSATALMTTYVTKAQMAGEIPMDELMKLMESEKERSKVFFEAPRYFQTLVASYTCGMGFLVEGNLAALMTGGELVGKNFLSAVKNPPRSSEQILHPEKYWSSEKSDEPVVVDDEAVTAFLESRDHHVAGVNTGGEIIAGVLTTPADREFNPMASGMASYWTTQAATGWGGDRFYLLETEGDGSAGVWITLWDTEEDRDEFVESYEAEVEDADRTRTPLGERGAVFTYGMSPDAGKKLADALAESGLGFSQGDEPWTP